MAITLGEAIDQLADYIPQWDQRSEKVSQAAVGWHIEHSLLVIRSIVKALERSDPAAYKASFYPAKTLILTTGRFPRGAQSPAFTRPPEVLEPSALADSVLKTQERLKDLEPLEARHHFTHPYLGVLGLVDAQRFMVVHTRHHMRIIADILQSGQKKS